MAPPCRGARWLGPSHVRHTLTPPSAPSSCADPDALRCSYFDGSLVSREAWATWDKYLHSDVALLNDTHTKVALGQANWAASPEDRGDFDVDELGLWYRSITGGEVSELSRGCTLNDVQDSLRSLAPATSTAFGDAPQCGRGAYKLDSESEPPVNGLRAGCPGYAVCEPGFYCSGGIRRPCPGGTVGTEAGLHDRECSGRCAAACE